MSRISPSFSRRLKWRLEYGVYLIFEKSIGLLTPRQACLVGERLGVLVRLFSAKHRRIVERNLRIAFAGEKSPDEIADLAKAVFRRSGANLIASLCTASLEPEELNRAVTIENIEVLTEALGAGKGVVGVMSHMGNWEALAQKFPRVMPPDVTAGDMYRRLNNPLLDRRLLSIRQRMGLRLFEKSDNPLKLASFLRAGNALGIICDQRANKIGETVPFFGRLTACTPLPSLLARRTGARVVAISVTTLVRGKWLIKFHRLEGEPTTENCMRLLEVAMRQSPADVFWFQDRWRVSLSMPQLAMGKSAGKAAVWHDARKKRRVLVWLEKDALPPPALERVEPDDLAFEYSVASDAAKPDWMPSDAIVYVRAAMCRRRSIAEEINRIDRAAALPLDFVYASCGSNKVIAVCRLIGMPVVAVPKCNP